jgi:hypothetical protein
MLSSNLVRIVESLVWYCQTLAMCRVKAAFKEVANTGLHQYILSNNVSSLPEQRLLFGTW